MTTDTTCCCAFSGYRYSIDVDLFVLVLQDLLIFRSLSLYVMDIASLAGAWHLKNFLTPLTEITFVKRMLKHTHLHPMYTVNQKTCATFILVTLVPIDQF